MVLGGEGYRIHPFNNYVACFEWVLTMGTCCMFFFKLSTSIEENASFATIERASNNSAGHPQKSDLDDDIDDMSLCQPSASFDSGRASNNPPSSANQLHPTLPLTKCIQASCQRIVMNMAMWCYNIENMDDMDYLPSPRILSNCQTEPATVQIHSCVTLHNLAQSCTILQKFHNLAQIVQTCIILHKLCNCQNRRFLNNTND